jgi:hypothetical protein
MADNLKPYNPNKGFISFRLNPDAIKEELKALIPYYQTFKYFHDNPDAPISETAQVAAQETPFIGSLLRGDYGDAAQEAILMGMPVPKTRVKMPNGKTIYVDREVSIDPNKTDKYNAILEKSEHREYPGAEYEGPRFTNWEYYNDEIPLANKGSEYGLSPSDMIDIMDDRKLRQVSNKDLNKDYKASLEDGLVEGWEDAYGNPYTRSSVNEYYRDYKVDPSDYTPKDAREFNNMLDDLKNGDAYYENLSNLQSKFESDIRDIAYRGDKRTRKYKDYKELEQYSDKLKGFLLDAIKSGYMEFKEGVSPRMQKKIMHDINNFRLKYNAPDAFNQKSASDFANKVIESKLREPKYTGRGSTYFNEDNFDLTPGDLRLNDNKYKEWNYVNPYEQLLNSGNYAVKPKDYNKIVDNSRIDNTMGAHREAIQSYADDVKRGLIELNDLTPQQKLKYNKQVSNILEPIINDTKLNIDQKKALITKEMKGLAEEIIIQREFN